MVLFFNVFLCVYFWLQNVPLQKDVSVDHTGRITGWLLFVQNKYRKINKMTKMFILVEALISHVQTLLYWLKYFWCVLEVCTAMSSLMLFYVILCHMPQHPMPFISAILFAPSMWEIPTPSLFERLVTQCCGGAVSCNAAAAASQTCCSALRFIFTAEWVQSRLDRHRKTFGSGLGLGRCWPDTEALSNEPG